MLHRIGVRLATLVVAAAAVLSVGTSAQAFPSLPPTGPPTDCTACPPGNGPTLFVKHYYNNAAWTTKVGQYWWGCPDEDPGSWGRETAYYKYTWTSCD